MLWFGVTERMQDSMCLLLNYIYNILKQKFWIGIEMKHPVLDIKVVVRNAVHTEHFEVVTEQCSRSYHVRRG
jgi:hypothetical protein